MCRRTKFRILKDNCSVLAGLDLQITRKMLIPFSSSSDKWAGNMKLIYLQEIFMFVYVTYKFRNGFINI